MKSEVICTMTDGHFSFSEKIPEDEIAETPPEQLFNVVVSNDGLKDLADSFLLGWVECISQSDECPYFAYQNPDAMTFKLEVKLVEE